MAEGPKYYRIRLKVIGLIGCGRSVVGEDFYGTTLERECRECPYSPGSLKCRNFMKEKKVEPVLLSETGRWVTESFAWKHLVEVSRCG